MNNKPCASSLKEQMNKSTDLTRLKQKMLVSWDSFSDFTYRFRDRVHRLIHGSPDYPCACMHKPAVSRKFKSFEELMVAENRRIGWTRFENPKEIDILYLGSSHPGTMADLYFHEYFGSTTYYRPNEITSLSFRGDPDWCRIEECRSGSNVLKDGRVIGWISTKREASADTVGLSKIQTTLDTFFLWTNGHLNYLNISSKIPDNEWDNPEGPVHSSYFIEALHDRPISTTMLQIEDIGPNADLNSKFLTFVINYIKFDMFSLAETLSEKPFEIPEKLLKCEFLMFKTALANAELLREEFKGWGMMLKYPDAKIEFDFFYEVVINWYNGESSQWRYLSLPCHIPQHKWDSLVALGIPVTENSSGDDQPSTSKITSEIEITRADGEKRRIDRDGESTAFFYFGNKGKYIIPLP